MNYVKTYQQLNESLTSVLYHFTRIGSLVEILRDGNIDMTFGVGTNSDHKFNKGKFYFFSMQTSRNGGYGKRRRLPVMLVMDGTKLNQNYKGGPINYWGVSGDDKLRDQMDELEERVVSDKQNLDLKYIKEIHVLNSGEMEAMAFIDKTAQKLKIPIFFYDNDKDYFNNNKSKSIELEKEFEFNDPEVASASGPDPYGILGVLVGADASLWKSLSDEIISLGFVDPKHKDNLIKVFRDFSDKWYLEYSARWMKENPDSKLNCPNDYKIRDMYSSISADIHNNRTSKNKFMKWVFVKMGKEMRKLKVKTFKDLVMTKYGKF